MATNTPNSKMWPVLDRIRLVLQDHMAVGESLNPTDGTRPVRKVLVAIPAPADLAYNLAPAIFVHQSEWDDTDEYTGLQVNSYAVTLTLVENFLATESAYRHALEYADELKVIAYGDHREWARAGGADLKIITTRPRGGFGPAPVEAGDNFLLQTDINMTVSTSFDFY